MTATYFYTNLGKQRPLHVLYKKFEVKHGRIAWHKNENRFEVVEIGDIGWAEVECFMEGEGDDTQKP